MNLVPGLQSIGSLLTFGSVGGRLFAFPPPCPQLSWNEAELHSCLVTPLGIQEMKILEAVEGRKGGVLHDWVYADMYQVGAIFR